MIDIDKATDIGIGVEGVTQIRGHYIPTIAQNQQEVLPVVLSPSISWKSRQGPESHVRECKNQGNSQGHAALQAMT